MSFFPPRSETIPMRILFLNNFNYLRGGSEKVMLEEMRLLREAGHEVAVFSRAHEKNEPAEFSEFFPPAMDTEHLGLSVQTLGTMGQLIYSRCARRGLREVISRFLPDVAHAHNIYGRLSLSVLDELKVQGIPVVMTLHDLKLLCPSYLMLNYGQVCERCRGGKFYHAALTRCHKGSLPASSAYALESYFNQWLGKYQQVARFIAPSRFLRDKCIAYGWHPDKFAYVPNFVENAPAPGSRGDEDYLVYLGRLSPEKGVRTLLAAYENLSLVLPLKIVGDGPERDKMEARVRLAGLHVTFVGHLRGESLLKTLAGARAVIVPSEWYENAPLSVLEAFSAGKPVLGARLGGLPELIDDGVDGLLFPPGNKVALAETLCRFFNMPAETVATMGRRARKKAEHQFNRHIHYERLLQIYKNPTVDLD